MGQIPKEVEEIYEELKVEITWLHGRWIIYRQLFAQSEKRIKLLNECAATFFFIIQDVLIGEVQISLSKLTDPARSHKYDNLSLEQLQLRIERNCDANFSTGQRDILDQIQRLCSPFRERRNKKLAHLDLNTARMAESYPLPGVSREMIGDALSMIRTYMNEIEARFHNSEFAYDMFSMRSDGEALVSMLKLGLRYEEIRNERCLSLSDWSQGEWHDA